MLQRKGRVRLPADLSEWLSKSTAGIFEAPLTHEIVLVSQQLPLHADPPDRFLAATAQVLGLVLFTADERLLGLSPIKTLGNRYRACGPNILDDAASLLSCRFGAVP